MVGTLLAMLESLQVVDYQALARGPRVSRWLSTLYGCQEQSPCQRAAGTAIASSHLTGHSPRHRDTYALLRVERCARGNCHRWRCGCPWAGSNRMRRRGTRHFGRGKPLTHGRSMGSLRTWCVVWWTDVSSSRKTSRRTPRAIGRIRPVRTRRIARARTPRIRRRGERSHSLGKV